MLERKFYLYTFSYHIGMERKYHTALRNLDLDQIAQERLFESERSMAWFRIVLIAPLISLLIRYSDELSLMPT